MDFSRLTDPQAYKDALAGLLRRGTEVGEYIEQAPIKVGQSIMDAGQRQSALMNKAFDPTGKTLIRDPQAANQAAMNLFEGPMSFAPAGITKVVNPQGTRKDIITQEIEKLQPTVDYRGSHIPPNYKEYGAPLHDLTQIMPKDIYGADAKRLYGIGDSVIDSEWRIAALKAKGKPEAEIEVFRAVPKGVKDINSGDWVTTSKKYATNHGENTLNGEYEIVSKKVKANTLSSEGYPYEFGYHQ